MRETPIENHLRKLVKRSGGLCYKWVSPGQSGVPDDIVIWPGMIFFVETKSTIGKLSAVQKVQHARLKKLDIEVVVLNSKKQVEEWVAMRVRALEITSRMQEAGIRRLQRLGACVDGAPFPTYRHDLTAEEMNHDIVLH